MYMHRGTILGEDVVHQRNGIRFIWDRGKAELNLRKHGLFFEAASEIFFDPLICLVSSKMIGGEERESAIGMTEGWRLLMVVYTFRQEAIRIISARPATLKERKRYEDATPP